MQGLMKNKTRRLLKRASTRDNLRRLQQEGEERADDKPDGESLRRIYHDGWGQTDQINSPRMEAESGNSNSLRSKGQTVTFSYNNRGIDLITNADRNMLDIGSASGNRFDILNNTCNKENNININMNTVNNHTLSPRRKSSREPSASANKDTSSCSNKYCRNDDGYINDNEEHNHTGFSSDADKTYTLNGGCFNTNSYGLQIDVCIPSTFIFNSAQLHLQLPAPSSDIVNIASNIPTTNNGDNSFVENAPIVEMRDRDARDNSKEQSNVDNGLFYKNNDYDTDVNQSPSATPPFGYESRPRSKSIQCNNNYVSGYDRPIPMLPPYQTPMNLTTALLSPSENGSKHSDFYPQAMGHLPAGQSFKILRKARSCYLGFISPFVNTRAKVETKEEIIINDVDEQYHYHFQKTKSNENSNVVNKQKLTTLQKTQRKHNDNNNVNNKNKNNNNNHHHNFNNNINNDIDNCKFKTTNSIYASGKIESVQCQQKGNDRELRTPSCSCQRDQMIERDSQLISRRFPLVKTASRHLNPGLNLEQILLGNNMCIDSTNQTYGRSSQSSKEKEEKVDYTMNECSMDNVDCEFDDYESDENDVELGRFTKTFNDSFYIDDNERLERPNERSSIDVCITNESLNLDSQLVESRLSPISVNDVETGEEDMDPFSSGEDETILHHHLLAFTRNKNDENDDDEEESNRLLTKGDKDALESSRPRYRSENSPLVHKSCKTKDRKAKGRLLRSLGNHRADVSSRSLGVEKGGKPKALLPFRVSEPKKKPNNSNTTQRCAIMSTNNANDTLPDTARTQMSMSTGVNEHIGLASGDEKNQLITRAPSKYTYGVNTNTSAASNSNTNYNVANVTPSPACVSPLPAPSLPPCSSAHLGVTSRIKRFGRNKLYKSKTSGKKYNYDTLGNELPNGDSVTENLIVDSDSEQRERNDDVTETGSLLKEKASSSTKSKSKYSNFDSIQTKDCHGWSAPLPRVPNSSMCNPFHKLRFTSIPILPPIGNKLTTTKKVKGLGRFSKINSKHLKTQEQK